MVIEIGETAGDDIDVTGQVVELLRFEGHVHFAGLAVGDVIDHRLGILFSVNARQPFRQVVTDDTANPRKLGIDRQLEHITPEISRHRLANQRERTKIGFARFVGDDRHSDFVISVVIAVLIGVRGKCDQASARPDLQGLDGCQYLGWHEFPELVQIRRIDSRHAVVLVVKVWRVRLKANVDLGLLQSFEPA
ncbi:hypothetical protein D3C86_1273710 [compost metagenome]